MPSRNASPPDCPPVQISGATVDIGGLGGSHSGQTATALRSKDACWFPG
jgi:hypothetical protein